MRQQSAVSRSEMLSVTSQNVFVGGENKWAYNTFTNWEFWWPGFPVVAYFKVSVPPPTKAFSS
jgi:hypothetical protein